MHDCSRIPEKHLDIAKSRFQPSPLVPLSPCPLPPRASSARVYPSDFHFLLSLLSHNNRLLFINSSKNPEKLGINRRSAYPKLDCESTFPLKNGLFIL